MNLVTFSIQSQMFCLPTEFTLEITRMVKVTDMPSATGKVNGLINYRGELLPVIDTGRYFNLGESTFGLNSVLIIVEHAGQKLSLACDSVLDILEVPESQSASYDGLGADYCHAAVHIGEQILPVLNLKKVVAEVRKALV